VNLGDSPNLYVEQRDRVLRDAEARAKEIKESAHPCAKCGRSMLGARNVHYGCDPEYPLAGLRCVCPPGCSGERWGSGPRDCDPDCEPCKRQRGQPLRKRRDT
jgi:hypothetical protein